MSNFQEKKRNVRNVVVDQGITRFMRLGFITLGALFLLFVGNGDARAAMSTFDFICALFVGVLMLFAGLPGLVVPMRFWDYGIDMQEGGFTYYQPLRKAKFIRYVDIHRIIGKTRNEGDGESFSQLLIYAGDTKVRLDEQVIWGSGVFDEIKALSGFRHEALPEFLAVEGSLKWALISKVTTLLDWETPAE